MKKNDFDKKDINIDDEKELNSLFDHFKNTKLKKTIKKAKWHSILRNVIISFLVFGVLMIGGGITNNIIVDKMWGPVQIATSSFNNISAPNQYIGKSSRYQGFLSGRTEYTTFKIIEDKVVYTGDNEYSYGLFKDYHGSWTGSESPSILGKSWDAGDLELQKYNELGQREMVFFYPFIDYTNYKNDLKCLDNITSNKVMEMALSFDKDYTIEEVNNLLPKDVTLSWYWLDDLNKQEKESSKSRKEKQQQSDGTTNVVDYPPRLRSEWTAYGIKAYDPNGTPLEEPEQHFIWALKNGMEYDTRFKSEFERVYNNIKGEDGKLTKDDIKVFGVVVTGDIDDLKALINLPFIKASSLGVVTEKY